MKPSVSGRRRLLLAAAAAGGLVAARGLAREPVRLQGPVGRGFEDSDMCVATDAAVEGPYYVNEPPMRADIRGDRTGVLLDLELRIVDAATCGPANRPTVDIWHCDALGRYSGFPVPDPRDPSTAAERWLRGRQRADRNGFVRFRTIYPGWYAPRPPHIHGKVWTGRDRSFTFQMYFPEALNREVGLRAPYSRRPPSPYSNASDIVIRMSGAAGSFLKMSRHGGGFRAALTVGIPAA